MILLNAPSRWRKGQGPGGVGSHGERASRTQEVRLEFCLQTALKLRFLGATKAHGLAHTQPHSPGIQEQVSFSGQGNSVESGWAPTCRPGRGGLERNDDRSGPEWLEKAS